MTEPNLLFVTEVMRTSATGVLMATALVPGLAIALALVLSLAITLVLVLSLAVPLPLVGLALPLPVLFSGARLGAVRLGSNSAGLSLSGAGALARSLTGARRGSGLCSGLVGGRPDTWGRTLGKNLAASGRSAGPFLLLLSKTGRPLQHKSEGGSSHEHCLFGSHDRRPVLKHVRRGGMPD